MMKTIRGISQMLYYKIMSPRWSSSFKPRIVNVDIPECRFRFFIGTEQAADWYDPPKSYAITEYRWVINNIDFENQRVLDVGAHHGHYSMLFRKTNPGPAIVRAVEPLGSNCALIEVNAALNGVKVEIIEAAISTSNGFASLLARPNAKLFPRTGQQVKTLTLADAMQDASIVKLDIEGEEFNILPHQLDSLPEAHTWIVEVHPNYGDPNLLASAFIQRGYKSHFLDRMSDSILPLDGNMKINTSTSLFFQRGY